MSAMGIETPHRAMGRDGNIWRARLESWPRALGSWLCQGCVALALAVAGGAPAAAESCPEDTTPVVVNVRSVFEQARLDHTKSLAAIGRLAQTYPNHVSMPSNMAPIGLMVSAQRYRANATFRVMPRRDGRLCVYVRSIDAELNARDITIYVPREYKRGSCNFEVVYEHEKQHMRILFRTLQAYAPRAERALERLAEDINPIVAASRTEVRDALNTRVLQSLKTVVDAMEAERDRRDRILDSPDNYRREQDKCPTWILP